MIDHPTKWVKWAIQVANSSIAEGKHHSSTKGFHSFDI
jgi:hypothetical protein